MKGFLFDLLHDLRQKRLAPLAILLLVALVAVPLVVMKPASEAPAGSDTLPADAAASAGTRPTVVQTVEDGSSNGGSDLGAFDSRNPFKPTGKVTPAGPPDGVAQLVTPVAPLTPGAGKPPSGGGGGAVVTPQPPVIAPKATSPRIVSGAPKLYDYVADVSFGLTGDERVRKGVKRLRILPHDRRPIVVFLGATADGKRAVFLVDGRLSQSGEGACKPSVKSCSFLYLRDDKDANEQFLTDAQGREYHLSLLGIRAVEVKLNKKESAKAARRRVRDGDRTRVVRFPVLAPHVKR